VDVIKKESYHLLSMQNERNGSIGVRGNGTVNTPVSVLHTKV